MPSNPLRFALAPDSFKGTLSAPEAAAAMAEGVRRAMPEAICRELPMADGGEGTAALLAHATGGERLRLRTEDPRGRPLEAELARLGDGHTFALDTAAASGLTLLSPAERDPLTACSAGTGRLLHQALQLGARTVVLGLGGSATVDGGKGLCEALGFRFLDHHGRPLAPGGGALSDLQRIDDQHVPPLVWAIRGRIRIACDVWNPLLGPEGAAPVFAPQKGADAAAVQRLAQGLARLAEVLRALPGPCGGTPEIATLPGTGAAGGIGATLSVLLGATLESGGELVFETAGYAEVLADCDLVIVGEGRMDAQTAHGKAPAVVARHARARGRPVLGVTGQPGPGLEALDGIDAWEACRPAGASLPTPEQASTELAAATARLVHRWHEEQGSL